MAVCGSAIAATGWLAKGETRSCGERLTVVPTDSHATCEMERIREEGRHDLGAGGELRVSLPSYPHIHCHEGAERANKCGGG